MTDTRGAPSLLQTAEHREHPHLDQLLREAMIDTLTPGVREQLVAQLRAALGSHLNTETAPSRFPPT